MCLSLTYEPWQFYATFVPGRAFAETLLTGVVPMTAVTNWFYLKAAPGYRSGRALGAARLFCLVSALPVHDRNLRLASAFMMLGVALWLFVVVPGFFFLRRQPEDLGMLPDGALPSGLKNLSQRTRNLSPRRRPPSRAGV